MHRSRIDIAGLSLTATLAGSPEKPALVLLHGWPHSSRVYDAVADELGQHHFVIAFDLPEIGDSRGAPSSGEKTVLADLILGAAERAGARKPVITGFDVGGMIAYAAARDHGQRVAGAVVTNTVVPGIDPWAEVLANPHIWHFAFHAIPELPEKLVSGHQREYFDYFINMLVGNKRAVTQELRDEFASAYERPEALKAGFDWYRALEADAKHNAQPVQIGTPLLYLRGDADGRTPEPYVAGLKKAGAQHVSSAVLRSCGEIAPVEASEDFVRIVGRFAADCRR